MTRNPLVALSLPLVLAVALASGTAHAGSAPPPAPTKLKDVLAPFKGKQVTVSVTGAKAEDAKQRKLLAVGDDFIAFELANGNKTYFMLSRVSSMVVTADQLTITLKD